MDNEVLNLLDNYERLLDPQPPVLDHKLKVFHDCHVHQRENDVRIFQKIFYVLSIMHFYDESVFVQYWAAINFQSGFVLTTCGQPFGHSMDSINEFEPYRVACLDHNSYVGRNIGECIGPPARVFFNQSPEWTRDVSEYNDKQYPQLQDAKLSNIRGSLFMPVIEGDQCIGILEIAMTIPKNNFEIEIRHVCEALETRDLKSSAQNENINLIDTLDDYSPMLESRNTPKKSRNSKSKNIARKDITKLFGLPKADAMEICRISNELKTLSENTFTKAHRMYGIWEWPCTRSGIVKSSAHMALIEHAKTYITSSDVASINSQLMQDNDNMTLEYLISNDGKRVGEQLHESASPVLLELHQHKNKRSRSEVRHISNNFSRNSNNQHKA